MTDQVSEGASSLVAECRWKGRWLCGGSSRTLLLASVVTRTGRSEHRLPGRELQVYLPEGLVLLSCFHCTQKATVLPHAESPCGGLVGVYNLQCAY